MTTTLTRADSEQLLISRVGGIFNAVNLDGTTVDGTNTDLNDPIGYGIRQVDGTVNSLVLVTDADVATVSTDDYDEYLDLAEYRALQNAQGAFASWDIKIGPRDEKQSKFGDYIDAVCERKKKAIEETYGSLTATISSGVIMLDFAEHDEENIDEAGN
jgi:hypothetical protein